MVSPDKVDERLFLNMWASPDSNGAFSNPEQAIPRVPGSALVSRLAVDDTTTHLKPCGTPIGQMILQAALIDSQTVFCYSHDPMKDGSASHKYFKQLLSTLRLCFVTVMSTMKEEPGSANGSPSGNFPGVDFSLANSSSSGSESWWSGDKVVTAAGAGELRPAGHEFQPVRRQPFNSLKYLICVCLTVGT
uniref:Uncharacterized protein n=1 Tax=Timema tahoe TaxID=61484 RepID=A0A7R9FMZ8_9NEOP|nr:unnamed protein product [Timema tahoe]